MATLKPQITTNALGMKVSTYSSPLKVTSKPPSSATSAGQPKKAPTGGSSYKTSFFSKAGQKAAVQRVGDAYGMIFNRGSYDTSLPQSATFRDYATKTLTSPLFVFGAPAAIAAIPAAVSLTGAAKAATGGIFAAKSVVPIGAAALGVGVLAGGALFGSKGAANAPQNMSQAQDMNASFEPNVPIDISPNVNPSIGGADTQSAGRDITTNRTNYTITNTYPVVSPTFSQTPTQSAEGSQSQQAATGTNWLPIVIGIGAALLLTRK